MDIVFHYPPELLQLLIDTIPLLCPRKKDVLLFFQGAGVDAPVTADLATKLQADRTSINKFEMARVVLRRLNERGEAALRERREILRRVVEFEDFSTCWESDQLKAKGLVAEIRRVVNVKDSFTRMDLERARERSQRIQAAHLAATERQERLDRIRIIHGELVGLFAETDAHKRGKALEGILNRLFKEGGILVMEAFTLRSPDTGGIVEQIDGVVQFEGHHYLVEMKWWAEPIGVGDVSQHLVRVFFRGHSRGVFISASGYTDPAIGACREALQKSVVLLAHLQEIVLLLERQVDLQKWFKEKVDAAIVHKNPFHMPSAVSHGGA